MAKHSKEKIFLDALGALFTGADVQGESGFVNLMYIKRAYFKGIRDDLMANIDARAPYGENFREELFDKLYTFFHRYFCESGSIYYRHQPAFTKTYESVYEDGQDVALTWKTHMLYYVKSEIIVQDLPVVLDDGSEEQHFFFDTSNLQHKKNNEKKEFVFSFHDVRRNSEGEEVVHLAVSYANGGKQTNTGDIIRALKEHAYILQEGQLQRAIAVFRRQTEADFFINKDACGFLREQFDLWMYQYIFREESVFEEKRIKQLQHIKHTAYEIIDFIAQFEDELRRVWEKPKFARSVHYVITLDKLSDAVLEKVAAHKGTTAQVKEWHELGMVEKGFIIKPGANAGEDRYLPLDTKYFKDLELEILDCLGSLDEALDGELVHSENWQALNTLRKRYAGKVKCVYIDPPYNAPSSKIDVYENAFRHSTWLTMMENRISSAQSYQTANDGALVVAIDENERAAAETMISGLYPRQRITAVTVVHNPQGIQGNNFSYTHEYALFVFNDQKGVIQKIKVKPRSQALRDDTGNSYLRTDAKNCFYPINVKDDKIIGFGDVADDEFHPHDRVTTSDNGCNQIWPIRDGVERKWRYARQSVERIAGDLFIRDTKRGIDVFQTIDEGTPKTVWTDSKYQAGDKFGTKLVEDLVGPCKFKFPKSVCTVEDSVALAIPEGGDAIVMDFFAGSGTTAHAVINLNRKDGGKRKYVLIEMGEHFNTVVLPRTKKVIYSADWENKKPLGKNGSSHCFKYYTLEQYEETLKNSRYQEDSTQVTIDSEKSPFEQYVFFGDDKLSNAVKPQKSGEIKIDLKGLYKDTSIAETLSHATGKPIRSIAEDSVTFTDGTVQKISSDKMTEKEKLEFISLIKPYLWWGE